MIIFNFALLMFASECEPNNDAALNLKSSPIPSITKCCTISNFGIKMISIYFTGNNIDSTGAFMNESIRKEQIDGTKKGLDESDELSASFRGGKIEHEYS